MTAQTTQVYNVFIRATPEQIWDAITKSEFTQQYFYGARIDVRDGPPLLGGRRHGVGRGGARVRPAAQARARVGLGVRPRHGGRGAEPRHLGDRAPGRRHHEADRRARPARGRAEDGRERRRRLDVRPVRPEDAARDRASRSPADPSSRSRPSGSDEFPAAARVSLDRREAAGQSANAEERIDAEDHC